MISMSEDISFLTFLLQKIKLFNIEDIYIFIKMDNINKSNI